MLAKTVSAALALATMAKAQDPNYFITLQVDTEDKHAQHSN